MSLFDKILKDGNRIDKDKGTNIIERKFIYHNSWLLVLTSKIL